MARERKNTLVRQKEILSAARKLIVQYGSEHVTVRRISKGIGVSEGAIYRHFKSKRDVLSFLVDDIEDTLLKDIEKNYAAGRNTLEILQKVAKGHISAIEQRKGVSFQVIAEIVSFGDKRLNKKMYDVINKYIDHIRGILAEGVETGVIRQDIDLEAAATLFFGMTQGLVNTWALSNYSFKLEEKYAHIWGAFREAVIKR